jgi:tetratricopeptide (TPR) repeat protein
LTDDQPTRLDSGSVKSASRDEEPESDVPDVRADAVEERSALGRLKSSLFARDTKPIELGRYRLEKRLAAGGVGVVYDAWDPELERRVAVKLMQARGGSSGEARARLLREAQAMARLSHPNIVPVYDVGTYDEPDLAEVDDAGVFVVMELIDGTRLDVWLRESSRSLAEILAVFHAAGLGLEAAHEAGIVHRDFKPSNVIVGADGRVRVLDFGLAAARDPAAPSADGGVEQSKQQLIPSGLATPLTMTGSVMGTPAYMAPEQHDGAATDPRTDQFSFCVALFHAVYRTRPFPQTSMEALAAAKKSGDLVKPPARPGVRAALADAILRGLRPAPSDRFDDLGALLRVLEPRSRVAAWLGVGLVSAALVGGATVWLAAPADAPCTTHHAQSADVWNDEVRGSIAAAFAATARPYAASTWSEVESRVHRRVDQWSALRTSTCQSALVDKRESTEWMHRVDACADRHLARIVGLLEVFAEADGAVVDGAVESVSSLPNVEECERAPLDVVPEIPAGVRAEVARADAETAAAAALGEAARYEEARARVDSASALAVQSGHAPAIARALLVAGELDISEGRHQRAVETLRQAVLEAERGGDAMAGIDALLALASALVRLARYEEAGRELDLAAARIDGRSLGDRWQFSLLRTRGGLEVGRGQLDRARETQAEALRIGTELYGRDDLRIADNLNSLGAVEQDASRPDAARAHFVGAHRIFIAVLGGQHPSVGMVENNLGNVAQMQEDFDGALAHFERSREIWSRAYGPDHPRVGDAHNNLGNLLRRRGELDRALASQLEGLRIRKKNYGEGHPTVGVSLLNLSAILLDRGEEEEALNRAIHAVDVLEAALGPAHPHLGYALAVQGDALLELERPAEARAVFQHALDIWKETLPEDAPPVLEVRAGLEKAADAD